MKPQAKQGFNIQASIYVDPDKLDEFFEAIRPMCEITQDEPECVFFEAYQAQDDPGHIRLVENWFVLPRATVVAGADTSRTASVEWFMTVSYLED